MDKTQTRKRQNRTAHISPDLQNDKIIVGMVIIFRSI